MSQYIETGKWKDKPTRDLNENEVIPAVAEVRCGKCGNIFDIHIGLWHRRETELTAQLAAVTAERDQARGREAKLREALEQVRNWLDDNALVGLDWIVAAHKRMELRAILEILYKDSAPSEAGEREKLGRELVKWAAEIALYSGECPLCGATIVHGDKEDMKEAHWPNCLTLRAAALVAADAGKDGAG